MRDATRYQRVRPGNGNTVKRNIGEAQAHRQMFDSATHICHPVFSPEKRIRFELLFRFRLGR